VHSAETAALSWSSRAVSQCAHLNPYLPGKPIETFLVEKGLSSALKLASNENPFGPPPAAVKAICHAATGVHLYPDGDGSMLKAALAAKHAITEREILLGNGSNEVLELFIRCFAGAGDEVIYSSHAFIVYALATVAAGARGISVPENDGMSHDLDAMSRAVNSATRLVCIANPNNPTGTLHTISALQAFLDGLPRAMIILLDEAYHEYVKEEIGDSMTQLSHPGLIFCRTFSKAYGLAGCRVGYAVGAAEIISLVNRFREPFNVNSLAMVAACAALQEETWVMAGVGQCLRQRRVLEAFLARKGCLGGKSHANFVLLRHPRSGEILSGLEACGIIPRPLHPYGLNEMLRITVGRPEENRRLMAELDRLLAGLKE